MAALEVAAAAGSGTAGRQQQRGQGGGGTVTAGAARQQHWKRGGSIGRAAEAEWQRCGDGGQCGGGFSSARATEAVVRSSRRVDWWLIVYYKNDIEKSRSLW